MKVINYLFIFSLCYANCFFSARAMDSSDSSEEDQDLQQKHFSSYKPVSFKSSLSQSKASKGVGTLGPEEFPFPRRGQVYVGDKKTGKTELKKITITPSSYIDSDITIYAGDIPGEINYLTSGDEHSQESFAYTRAKTYKGSRKYPLKPYQYKFKTEDSIVLSFDRGHGIDHADGDKDSSAAFENYTPQVSFYNQHIRNPLVKRIRQNQGAYKEIAIYDDAPLQVGGGARLPIGFIFMEFYNHKKAHTYYFPNLIAYKSVEDEDGDILEGYEEFCKFFDINDEGAFKNSILELGAVKEHTRAVHDHSWIGYRTLSGRFQIVPEDHGGIPRTAQIALHKMIAIYHLQQTGELEFKSIEQKAALVQTFSSRFKYLTFDSKDPVREAARQKNSEKFWSELSKAGISEDEYLYCLPFANPEKLNSESKKKYKKLTEIEERCKLEEDQEAGEDLYNLDHARYWLDRIEGQLNREKSTIEEKELLLELYQIPGLRNAEIIKKEKVLKKTLVRDKRKSE